MIVWVVSDEVLLVTRVSLVIAAVACCEASIAVSRAICGVEVSIEIVCIFLAGHDVNSSFSSCAAFGAEWMVEEIEQVAVNKVEAWLSLQKL